MGHCASFFPWWGMYFERISLANGSGSYYTCGGGKFRLSASFALSAFWAARRAW